MARVDSVPRTLNKDLSLYTLAYVLALVAALVVGYLFRELHPILVIFTADISATLVVYVFSRIFHNSSFYDAYWSLAPLTISIFWLLGTSFESVVTVRQIIVTVLVFVWGLRLTYNWVRQWQGLKHEDWRYQDLRKQSPKWFWLIDLVGIEVMPTVIVFLGCLSLYPAVAVGKNPFGLLDLIAIIITAGAIVIETIADEQLRRFALKKRRSGEIMSKGLWAYSRHPNYFGEVLFWWGLYLFALAAEPRYWWTVIGPMSITVLFTTVSVPLMEKRSLERRTAYQEHRKKVPALFPWIPKT